MADDRITADEIGQMMRALEGAYKSVVSLEEWLGVPVHTDETLPKGIAELRDEEGVVITRYDLRRYG